MQRHPSINKQKAISSTNRFGLPKQPSRAAARRQWFPSPGTGVEGTGTGTRLCGRRWRSWPGRWAAPRPSACGHQRSGVRRPQPSDHHRQPLVEPPEEAACRLAAKFIGSRASSAKDHRIQGAGGHGGSMAARSGSAMTRTSCLNAMTLSNSARARSLRGTGATACSTAMATGGGGSGSDSSSSPAGKAAAAAWAGLARLGPWPSRARVFFKPFRCA